MLLSIEGVARRLGISERTARGWVAQIPAVMIGKRRRWRSETIDAALRDSTIPPQLTADLGAGRQCSRGTI